MVLVTGRAEVEEERIKFIADDLAPLAGLRERRAEAASVLLTGTGLEEETLDALGRILASHRGEVPISIQLALPHRMTIAIQTGRSWKVRPSAELTAAVVGLLGPGAVVYRAGGTAKAALRTGPEPGLTGAERGGRFPVFPEDQRSMARKGRYLFTSNP